MHVYYSSPRRLSNGPGREFGRLRTPANRTHETFSPAVDIREEAERFVVQADLPGVDAEAIELTVEGDRLTIRGERRLEPAADGAPILRGERRGGRFERIFRLPETAAGDGVEARYRHGVLTVAIPKSRAALPYRIEVTQH